jgi:hypothetical protein
MNSSKPLSFRDAPIDAKTGPVGLLGWASDFLEKEGADPVEILDGCLGEPLRLRPHAHESGCVGRDPRVEDDSFLEGAM